MTEFSPWFFNPKKLYFAAAVASLSGVFVGFIVAHLI